MPNLHRQEKLGELIVVELSDLLRTRLKDPRVGFASITHVEVSGDLSLNSSARSNKKKQQVSSEIIYE